MKGSHPSDDGTEMVRHETHKKKRKKKHYFLRLLIIVAFVVCAYIVTHIDYFDINGIAVIGNDEISDEEIIHLSEIDMGDSIFDVHPLLVQHKIKENLYIEDVNVDRKFPNKIEIHVTERSCRAQFVKGNKYIITDKEGTVIDISSEEKVATLVKGVTVTEAKKKKEIGVKEEGTLEKALEFISVTEKNDLFFKAIAIDGSNIDAYVYDELKCSGSYNDMLNTIKSGTLKLTIYDLYQKGTEKGTVKVYGDDYCFFTP